jgi:predicted Ser/Thr protein kinase
MNTHLFQDEIDSIVLHKYLGNNIYSAYTNKRDRIYLKTYSKSQEFEDDLYKYKAILLDAWLCDPDYGVIVLKYNPHVTPFISNPISFTAKEAHFEFLYNNDLSRFGCSYTDGDLNCEGLYENDIVISQLSKELIDKIRIGDIIGKGTDAVVYRGQLEELYLAIKIGKIYHEEICIQSLVAKYGLAPKIYSVQKCTYATLLIMEQIQGQPLSRFIAKNNDDIIIDVFLNAVKTVIYLGVELLIDHGDLHKNNIMITYNYKVIIIDFGVSTRTEAPTLHNYKVFIEEFYNTLYPYVKYGKIRYQSNATKILCALKTINNNLQIKGRNYIHVYKEFEEDFFKHLPVTVSKNTLERIISH